MSKLEQNTVALQKLLNDVNNLPDAGEGGTPTPTQRKTVSITTNGIHTVTPDNGYALSEVTANVFVPIPEGYIEPSGNLEITENGHYDITEKATVTVNVTVGGVTPDNRNLYQRVEYIESNGEQYIITDFVPNNESGMELIASFPTLVDRVPMGSRYDSGTTRFYIPYPLSASSVYVAFNSGASISCKLTADTQYRLQMNFLNGRSARVHELSGLQKVDESISGTLPQHNGGIAIFGYRNDTTDAISSRRAMKCYGARCSQENEVVREYIPCYRKSDGEIGLYEKFSGQFLTNDGTGTFTTGADTEW